MFTRLERLLRKLFDWYEFQKGRPTIIETIGSKARTHYKVKTEGVAEFKIHCVDCRYDYTYRGPMYRPKTATLYRVYCEFDDTIPVEIQQKLSKSMTFPILINPLTSEDYKRKTAVQMYLDIVLSGKKT